MIVDDEADQQFTIKKIIENWHLNYDFITANNGKECLDLLERNETPDLIIMDVMMPEMSGWQTYQKIKENELWREIPILFLTARTDEVAKNAGSFLGDEFIEKPIDSNLFKQKIEKLFKKYGE
jgi:CheY-like chemotaxis protein